MKSDINTLKNLFNSNFFTGKNQSKVAPLPASIRGMYLNRNELFKPRSK